MTLAELYASLGAHPGSWSVGGIPTPDWGATEKVGGSNILPQNVQNVVAPLIQQRTGLNIGSGAAGGSTLGEATINNDGGGGTLPPTNPPPAGTTQTRITTGGGATTGDGTGSNDQALAQSAYDIAQSRIRDLFSAGREQVQNERNNAVNRFNDIMSAVDAFKTRAQDLWKNAGQEITNSASDIMSGNAVNSRNLVGKATGQARSLGLGLSSRMNLGQGLLQNLESTQGNTMAKRGEQDRANQVQLDQRIDTGDAQARDAETAKSAALASADAYDRVNVANYGTNSEQAGLDFANLLNNVVNYNRSLQAMATPDAKSLVQLQPDMAGIQSSIGSVLASLPSSGVTTGNVASNLATPTSLVDLLKKQGLYGGSTSL